MLQKKELDGQTIDMNKIQEEVKSSLVEVYSQGEDSDVKKMDKF